MEAALRPSMQPLSDLPVEEPVDPALSAAQSAQLETAAPDEEGAAAAIAAPVTDAGGTQTLELMDPEMLLASGAVPATREPETPEAPQVLEVDPDAPLTLEDTMAVDRMLSAASAAAAARAGADSLTLTPEEPVPAAASTASTSPPSGAAPLAKPASAAPAAAPEHEAATFVPLARRASLNAAAMKLAAAAPGARPAKAPARVNPAGPAAPVTTLRAQAASAAPAATAPGARTPRAARPAIVPIAPAAPAAPGTAASAQEPDAPPAADAPSLASWANARAAAAAASKSGTSPAARTGAPAARPPQPAAPDKARAATPASAPAGAAAAVAAPAVAATASPRGMDRDFIARNQVVERYLSGKLPVKAATDFERYCKEHPELLDELGLPERVNAGLRLLETSGKDEPWQEAGRPLWQQPMVTLGLGGLAAVLAITLALVAVSSAGKTHRILELQRQVTERTLDPAASTRMIRLLPNRSGATNTPAITIGGGAEAQLADLRIDETRSPFRDFRVTIDRIDQGRVMVIDNLAKDSNGHLRIAVNSSALGPGNYLLTIEGVSQRFEPTPDSWVTIGIAQR